MNRFRKHIYDCFVDFLLENGRSPSLRELSFRSHKAMSTCRSHMEKLVEEGAVSKTSLVGKPDAVYGNYVLPGIKKFYAAYVCVQQGTLMELLEKITEHHEKDGFCLKADCWCHPAQKVVMAFLEAK